MPKKRLRRIDKMSENRQRECGLFVRGIDKNMNITEDFPDFVSVEATTIGVDSITDLKKVVQHIRLPWDRYACLATNHANAQSVIQGKSGLVKLLKMKHMELCIIRQLAAVRCILQQKCSTTANSFLFLRRYPESFMKSCTSNSSYTREDIHTFNTKRT